MARPSEYNFEMCKEICEQVANGQNVIDVLNGGESYPSWSTFRHWKIEHAELQTLYIKAIQDKATAVDQEIGHLMAECKAKVIDPSTANVLIQTLKWRAAKYYPKMFGEKVDVTTDGEKIKSPIMIVPDSIANQMLKDVDNSGLQDSQLKK